MTGRIYISREVLLGTRFSVPGWNFAWARLIGLAAFTAHDARTPTGHPVRLERGQALICQSTEAATCGLTEQSYRRFLASLGDEVRRVVRRKGGVCFVVVTLEKYDEIVGHDNEAANGPANGPAFLDNKDEKQGERKKGKNTPTGAQQGNLLLPIEGNKQTVVTDAIRLWNEMADLDNVFVGCIPDDPAVHRSVYPRMHALLKVHGYDLDAWKKVLALIIHKDRLAGRNGSEPIGYSWVMAPANFATLLSQHAALEKQSLADQTERAEPERRKRYADITGK